MNTYKFECSIKFYKDVEVQAKDSYEASDKVLYMRDAGLIEFTELDSSPDGMCAGSAELISGEEPFTVETISDAQRERLMLRIAHYMPITKVSMQNVSEFMWAMLNDVTSQEELNDLLTDNMVLSEWINTRLADEL